MPDNFRRRLLLALLLSFMLHTVLLLQVQRVGFDIPNVTETVTTYRTKIVRWKPPPPPTPEPTAPPPWKQLDRSMLKSVHVTPADEQIVILAARQGDGSPSRAPHILRVIISPGAVRPRSVMHIKVLTAATATGAEGVYVRFILWEVAVPPVGAFRLPGTDHDYPGQRYELFERDYEVPPIPAIYRNRSYNIEVIATGREGIASGAFVPVRAL